MPHGYITHATQVLIASIEDAVGLVWSAAVQILQVDTLSPRQLVRLFSKLVLATWLLVAPAITDIQYLTSSNRTRSYRVHPPDDFQDGHKYPAVIAFHGGSGLGLDADGFGMELDIRLSLPLVRTAYSRNVSD